MQRLHPVAFLLVVSLVLHGCGGKGGDGADSARSAAGRVGLVLGANGHPEYRDFEASVRDALEEHDQQLVIQNAQNDPARQRQLVETLAQQTARAIVVVPLDSTSLRPAVDAAAGARVPVFTIGIPIRGARVTTHMEADFHAAGTAAAEYINAFLGKDLHAAVVGPVAAHGGRELESAFRRAVAVVDTRVVQPPGTSDGTREGAAAATTALLEKDPSLDAIFALDAASALGAMDAAYAHRRADLVIVAYGSTPEVIQAIGDTGPMRAAIVQQLDEASKLLAQAIVTQVEGDPVTPAIKVPVRLVNADSARAAAR